MPVFNIIQQKNREKTTKTHSWSVFETFWNKKLKQKQFRHVYYCKIRNTIRTYGLILCENGIIWATDWPMKDWFFKQNKTHKSKSESNSKSSGVVIFIISECDCPFNVMPETQTLNINEYCMFASLLCLSVVNPSLDSIEKKKHFESTCTRVYNIEFGSHN